MELARGEDRYEAARRAAVWNRRGLERYPDRIVQAADEVDVVRAVESARAAGMRVGVRSGGHSWVGNHLRDGGLLLDVGQLRGVEIDADAMIASVGPGCPGNELAAALAAHELFFPGGHCPGVCVGGYLLQGGFGWNGRVHGPACMSVEAIDVVTADGERLRADADHHPICCGPPAEQDRGSSQSSPASIFGATHARRSWPTAYTCSRSSCSTRSSGGCGRSAPSLERIVELMVFVHRDAGGEPEIVVTGPVLADTDEQARTALAVFERCPSAEARSSLRRTFGWSSPTCMPGSPELPGRPPLRRRQYVDACAVGDLLPGLRRIAETIPEAPSHMVWMNWGPGTTPPPARPDMAFSVEDDTYIALYAVWQDPADDDANIA